MYFTDAGIEELDDRRGGERVSMTWLAERLVARADARPTPSSLQYYGWLKGRLDGIQGELQVLMEKEVKDFNTAVAEAKIPPVAAAPRAGS